MTTLGSTYYHFTYPRPSPPPWASGYHHLQLYPLPPHGLQELPPSALHTTTPIGFRYYHLQPYKLPPPLASGITTFSPTTRTNICFSQCFMLVEFSCRSIVGQCISLAEQVFIKKLRLKTTSFLEPFSAVNRAGTRPFRGAVSPGNKVGRKRVQITFYGGGHACSLTSLRLVPTALHFPLFVRTLKKNTRYAPAIAPPVLHSLGEIYSTCDHLECTLFHLKKTKT